MLTAYSVYFLHVITPTWCHSIDGTIFYYHSYMCNLSHLRLVAQPFLTLLLFYAIAIVLFFCYRNVLHQ